ncbi:MAG: phage tail protein [Acetobacteraceae bacterium]
MSGSVVGAALAAVGFGDFAALGSVSFMLLGSPEQLSRSRRSVYGKLAVIGAAPSLQWIYDDLEQLTMGIRLHTFWCDPDSAVALLDSVRTAHQPQSLVFGAGQMAGQYVITEITATDEWRYAGFAQHIDCRLTLSQWVATLPPGAPSVQPVGPSVGIIGVPAGFTAIYAWGAGLGMPLPTPGFLSAGLSAVTRAGAL